MSGLSLSAAAGNGAFSAAPFTLTIAIPANSAVGVVATIGASGAQGFLQGAVTDTGGNTYISGGGANPGAGNQYVDSFYCLNTGSTAASVTYTINASLTGVFEIFVGAWAWTISGGTATFGSQSNNIQTAPGTGTNAITTGSVNCAAGSVIMGSCNNSGNLTAGTGFTQDSNNGGFFTEHGTFSASQAATFTTSVGGDGPLPSQAISFGFSATPTDTIPCGTTVSGATVATGTGGTALPAFAVGDCIVVLTMAQTASALTETFNGDGSNAYTHLQVADNHSTEGFILSRYATIVTTPLASPVLQSTFSGSATKLGIAAVKVGSISPGSPFVPGGNAQHLQTTPSGTNSQVSGLTTSANTNIPVTLVAWGLSVNFAGAPTAGSGFTPQGTAWSAFGAPSLTCETQTSSSLIQQQATFTPIGGSDTYTFLDVFNQLSVAFQIIMGQACL